MACFTNLMPCCPQVSSGIAEIIKYGLIRDVELFAWLEANMDALLARDPKAIAHAVRQSCINKVPPCYFDQGMCASASTQRAQLTRYG